jgi:hypothetical protein
MPDWPKLVAACLGSLDLDPATRQSVVEEIAQHVENRYEQLVVLGWPVEAAQREALGGVSVPQFAHDLVDALNDA